MEKQQEELQEGWHATKVNMSLAGTAFVTSGIIDLAAHLGPGGVVLGALATVIAARHGDDIAMMAHKVGIVKAAAYVRRRIVEQGFAQTRAGREKTPLAVDEEEGQRADPDEIVTRPLPTFPVLPPPLKGTPLFQPGEIQAGAVYQGFEKAKTSSKYPAQFKMDEVLEYIAAENAQKRIYFGRSNKGEVSVPLGALYHVIDVSNSGKGKSNRLRLAMAQLAGLCETYYINPLANAVKPVEDARQFEIWEPIFKRMACPDPVRKGGAIFSLLTTLVEEMERRQLREEAKDFSWFTRPVFLFIDEMPAVMKLCPEAAGMIDAICRMGRQFKIFVWIASQTALVKSIGLSTDAQGQFQTVIFGGGDATSAARLMQGIITAEQGNDLGLNGAGLTIMKVAGLNEPTFVRAPLVMNETMFELMGLPPFQLADWVKLPDQQAEQTLHVEAQPVQPTMAAGPDLSTVLLQALGNEEVAQALLTILATTQKPRQEESMIVQAPAIVPVPQATQQQTLYRKDGTGQGRCAHLSPDPVVRRKLEKVLQAWERGARKIEDIREGTTLSAADARRSLHALQENGLIEAPTDMAKETIQLPIPIIAEKGPKAEDIDINKAINDWNEKNIRTVEAIEKHYGMTHYQAHKLHMRIIKVAKERREQADLRRQREEGGQP